MTLGLKGTDELPRLEGGAPTLRRVAQLTLGIGQVYAPLEVFAGQTLRLGEAELEVSRVDVDALDYRWRRSPGGAAPPQVRAARGPRFTEAGLYALPDGRVVGVGKVTALAKSDGRVVEVLSLALFPPGYARDPLQDYALLPRVVAGKALGPPGLQVQVVQLGLAAGDAPGWVELRFPR